VPFNIFAESLTGIALVLGPSVGTRYASLHPVETLPNFFIHAKAGTLPPVTFLDPNYINEGPVGDDEHPSAQIQIGQQATWKIVDAVLKSPQWPHMALFITYDEGGGEYDHVSPPAACAPDDIPPMLSGSDVGTVGDFTQYGFRVPVVIVSPYAKKGFVSHTVYSHTSITRFIEAKFKLPALTARDANADPFSDMFDWTNPPFVKPPTFAEPTIDEGAVTFCKATY
jgi:phospholipase C